MEGGLKMKKWFLVITVLTVILSGMSCARPKPIPPAAISEIYALSEARTWLYGKYIQVKAVEDRSDFCYIMIYIKSLPGEVTTVKDGEVNVLGHTRYDAKAHTFHDFERYETKATK